MAYLAFHVWFGFTAVSGLLDSNMSSGYRVLNLFMCVVSLFVTLMVMFAHPAWLGMCKGSSELNTLECYWEVKRKQKFSELIVFNRLLVPTVMALSVPLVHPLICLLGVLILMLVRCVLVLFIKFRSLRHKVHYVASFYLQFALHITVLGFYSAANTLQKMNVRHWSGFGFFAVVLICLIVLIEFIHICF